MTKTFVLYHGNCMDGFGAAYSAWLTFRDGAKYIAVQYKGDLTYDDIPAQIKTGDNHIYLLDFCYSGSIIRQLIAEGNTVTILDHHRTAKENIESLRKDGTIPKDKLNITFDMDRSGAGIAWDYFQFLERPAIIKYLEDSDLWKFELPESKKIRAYMQSVPYRFKDYEDTHKDMDDEVDFSRVAYAGAILLRFQEKQVEQICRSASIKNTKYGQCAFLNSNMYVSEVGNALLKMYPEIEYSMSYRAEEEGTTTFSLRSTGREADVGRIAESFGGGGHPAAAGFVINKEIPEALKEVQQELMESNED